MWLPSGLRHVILSLHQYLTADLDTCSKGEGPEGIQYAVPLQTALPCTYCLSGRSILFPLANVVVFSRPQFLSTSSCILSDSPIPRCCQAGALLMCFPCTVDWAGVPQLHFVISLYFYIFSWYPESFLAELTEGISLQGQRRSSPENELSPLLLPGQS